MKILQIISTFVLIVFIYGCQKFITEPETTLPEAPAALASSTVSSDKVTLSWTDRSTNETGFRIERKTGVTVFTGIATVAANITTYTDLSVAPNTTYTYRIVSYNAAGN